MNALITGGIGDFIAVLNHAARMPSKILLATPRAGEIAELASVLGIDVRVLECKKVYLSREDVQAVHGTQDADLAACDDWSISRFFMQIFSGQLKFERNILELLRAGRRIAGSYTVINPSSLNHQDGRDFTVEESWRLLEHVQGKIVLLGLGTHYFPEDARIVDLMGQTSVCQAASILRHADACYAVDSWIGNAACQFSMPVRLKSVNPQYYFARSIYQAPRHAEIITRPDMYI